VDLACLRSVPGHRFEPVNVDAPVGVSADNHPVVIDTERVGVRRSREIDEVVEFTLVTLRLVRIPLLLFPPAIPCPRHPYCWPDGSIIFWWCKHQYERQRRSLQPLGNRLSASLAPLREILPDGRRPRSTLTSRGKPRTPLSSQQMCSWRRRYARTQSCVARRGDWNGQVV
jgi:hypothetical protein